MDSCKSSVETTFLSEDIIYAMLSYLKDFYDLVISKEELFRIKRIKHLIACMIRGKEDIIFQWQIASPVYVMGRNLKDAYERDDGGDVCDDDPIFTGYWQEL